MYPNIDIIKIHIHPILYPSIPGACVHDVIVACGYCWFETVLNLLGLRC